MLKLEEFEQAHDRANAREKELSAKASECRSQLVAAKAVRDALEADPDRLDMETYLAACATYAPLLQKHARAAEAAANAKMLVEALRDLPRTWHMAIPGRWTGSVAWFFVRSHLVQDGKPAAYDPFWIRSLIKDERGDFDALSAKQIEWLRDVLQPESSYVKSLYDPRIIVIRPFGAEDEVQRAACPACSAGGYVVGRKEVIFASGSTPLQQGLYLLCGTLDHLSLLAERRDMERIDLHPPPLPGAL